jgi:hypothetical protein
MHSIRSQQEPGIQLPGLTTRAILLEGHSLLDVLQMPGRHAHLKEINCTTFITIAIHLPLDLKILDNNT